MTASIVIASAAKQSRSNLVWDAVSKGDTRDARERAIEGVLATWLNQLPETQGVSLGPWDRVRIDQRILEDAAGRAELQRLGARSIPVLSRGDEFVFAQNIAQVVAFLKLNEKAGPVLSPAHLFEAHDPGLSMRHVPIVSLMRDERLDAEVPNRPRSYRALAHHMFRIPESFVEIAEGAFFDGHRCQSGCERADTASTAALAAYGGRVRDEFKRPRLVAARRRTNRRKKSRRPITGRRNCTRCWSARPGISDSTRGNG